MFRKTAKGLEQNLSIIFKGSHIIAIMFRSRKELPKGKGNKKGYH